MIEEKIFYAHPTAVIDDGCVISPGTKIWHFSHTMPNSTIGDNCTLGQNETISPGVVLGRNVKVQNNVSIYSGIQCGKVNRLDERVWAQTYIRQKWSGNRLRERRMIFLGK